MTWSPRLPRLMATKLLCMTQHSAINAVLYDQDCTLSSERSYWWYASIPGMASGIQSRNKWISKMIQLIICHMDMVENLLHKKVNKSLMYGACILNYAIWSQFHDRNCRIPKSARKRGGQALFHTFWRVFLRSLQCRF
jgi:hypothetical protein